MSDNTLLNPGSGGNVIRTLDRTGTGAPKTEVVQLDLGGPAPGAEKLITAGQQTMANSVPVVIASDQSALPLSIAGPLSVTQSGAWTVGVNNFPASQAVTGTVGATQSGTWTVQQGGAPWSVSQSGAWSVSVSNFPATQPVSGSVSVTGSVSISDFSTTLQITHGGVPQPVYLADTEHLFDDDGALVVTPSQASDPATGTAQQLGLAAVTKLLSGVQVTNFPATQPVSVTNQPANSSLELAGQLQRVADLLEAVLLEQRKTNIILSSLGQPIPEDPDRISADVSLN